MTRKPGSGRTGFDPLARNEHPFEAIWRQRFEEFATDHDDDAGIAGWTSSGLDTRMRRFLRLWRRDDSRRRWLDAGCGAGTYSRALRDRGLDVVALDYSLVALVKARARGTAGVSYVSADIRRIPFLPESFDGVLCLGVTQALSDSEAALRELTAQIKPGGEIWVDGLNRWCLIHAWDILKRTLGHRPIHLRYESPAEVERILRSLGLKDVRAHWMPILPPRLQRYQSLVESPAASFLLRAAPFLGLLFCHAFIVYGRRA